MAGGVDPTIGAPSRGAVTAVRVAGDASAAIADLRVGQTVSTSVVQVLPSGGVLIGLMGSRLHATTNLQLVAGQNYDFVVVAKQPALTLTPSTPGVRPSQTTAAGTGLLGSSGAPLHRAIVQLLQQASSGADGLALAKAPQVTATNQGNQAMPGAPTVDHGAIAQELGSLLQRLGTGAASATDLATLGRDLGHDLEARVLRLSRLTAASQNVEAEAESLRQTLKAVALRTLGSDAAHEGSRRAAQSMVEGLRFVESDNAARADQGSAQWLPLPVAGEEFLRDARMFMIPAPDRDRDRQEAAETGESAGAFKVVLLLDLTRLGAVRVDVDVRENAVAVTLQLTNQAVLAQLVTATGGLAQRLTDEGLEVRHLRVQMAKGQELPVADLVRIPESREDSSLLDVHA